MDYRGTLGRQGTCTLLTLELPAEKTASVDVSHALSREEHTQWMHITNGYELGRGYKGQSGCSRLLLWLDFLVSCAQLRRSGPVFCSLEYIFRCKGLTSCKVSTVNSCVVLLGSILTPMALGPAFFKGRGSIYGSYIAEVATMVGTAAYALTNSCVLQALEREWGTRPGDRSCCSHRFVG